MVIPDSAVCCITFSILLVLMTGAATLTGFAVDQMQQNQPTTRRFRENSSVILTEFSHFFTESLTVTEDTEHQGDFHHDIDVHRVESQCNDVIKWINTTTNGADHSSILTFYVVAGSSLSLNICGYTNSTTYPERLEIVLQDHLEEPNSNDPPYKVSYFDPGLNSELTCKPLKFDLPTNNYYTLSFLPPSIPMTFEFQLAYNIRVVDPNLLAQHTVANYTLHMDQDSFTFALSDSTKYSCFVAMIRENPNALNKDVHIKLTYSIRWHGLITGSVLLFVFFAIIVTLSSVVAYKKLIT